MSFSRSLGTISSSRCQTTRDKPASRPRDTYACANLFSYGRAATGRSGSPTGGARRDRTDDLLLAKQALSQLSYGPESHGTQEKREMVGLGRFELPTSRLSSARSNQLSYRPKKRTLDPAHPTGRRAKGCSNDHTEAWARPRRKRNGDGEVPLKDSIGMNRSAPMCS